jgi:transcriptional regulator with XRE-family HTH domain
MAKETLGSRLREIRELRSLSLNELARRAKISAAYLQKLEKGDVKEPSPHILQSLATQLKIPYSSLMKLAGYLVPTTAKGSKDQNSLAHALSSEDLTDDEVKALARYLAWYRHSRQRGF